jgi:hypothetical protein
MYWAKKERRLRKEAMREETRRVSTCFIPREHNLQILMCRHFKAKEELPLLDEEEQREKERAKACAERAERYMETIEEEEEEGEE